MSPGHYPEAAICQLVLQDPATQSSGSYVNGRIHAAFSSTLTWYSTRLQCPKVQAGQSQIEDSGRTQRNKTPIFELSATM